MFRRREADLLMPLVGDPLARVLVQELREIATEGVFGALDEGRNTGGGQFAGGRLLDGPATGIG